MKNILILFILGSLISVQSLAAESILADIESLQELNDIVSSQPEIADKNIDIFLSSSIFSFPLINSAELSDILNISNRSIFEKVNTPTVDIKLNNLLIEKLFERFYSSIDIEIKSNPLFNQSYSDDVSNIMYNKSIYSQLCTHTYFGFDNESISKKISDTCINLESKFSESYVKKMRYSHNLTYVLFLISNNKSQITVHEKSCDTLKKIKDARFSMIATGIPDAYYAIDRINNIQFGCGK